MASVIPGFIQKYDIDDLVSLTAPRKMLLVSAEEDKYSMDAPYIAEQARIAYEQQNASKNLCHMCYPGGHAMTQERFEYLKKAALRDKVVAIGEIGLDRLKGPVFEVQKKYFEV